MGGRAAANVSPEALREVLIQSALHLHKYKQIREDYNRLLGRCGGPAARPLWWWWLASCVCGTQEVLLRVRALGPPRRRGGMHGMQLRMDGGRRHLHVYRPLGGWQHPDQTPLVGVLRAA